MVMIELKVKDRVLIKELGITKHGKIVDIVKRRLTSGSYMFNRYLVLHDGIKVLYWKSQVDFDVDYYRNLDEV